MAIIKEKKGSEDMQERSNAHDKESQFYGQNLNRFMEKTERNVHHGISPGVEMHPVFLETCFSLGMSMMRSRGLTSSGHTK